MDISLRGIDAWRLCDVLRRQRHRPSIVMLTSPNACADVYLPNLYDTQEFLARVQGLLWKQEKRSMPAVQIGDLRIDRACHRVTRAGVTIDLSLREYSLLEALAINEGRVLTREAIQEKVWQNEESVSKTVDVYIGRLRRRIDAGHKNKLIQTIRGLGYCLRMQEMPDAGDIH
jgi:two-component system copper resistance phosphate regulon response regulator CusR